jgi:hypothetical protein
MEDMVKSFNPLSLDLRLPKDKSSLNLIQVFMKTSKRRRLLSEMSFTSKLPQEPLKELEDLILMLPNTILKLKNTFQFQRVMSIRRRKLSKTLLFMISIWPMLSLKVETISFL